MTTLEEALPCNCWPEFENDHNGDCPAHYRNQLKAAVASRDTEIAALKARVAELEGKQRDAVARYVEGVGKVMNDFVDLQAERDAIRAKLAECVTALESRSLRSWEDRGRPLFCTICQADADDELGPQHKPDCFISRCRALLPKPSETGGE